MKERYTFEFLIPTRFVKMRIYLLLAVFLGLSLSSCKENDIPEGLLAPEKMSHILKDLHLAEAYVNSNFAYNDSSKFLYKKLEDSILVKNGTQLATFDSSMVYYQKHIKLLDEIYAVTIDSLSLKESIGK